MDRGTAFQPELLGAKVFVAAGAVIVGDVQIGAESSVWFQAVIRGDAESIRVGRRTNIQDGCILHADPGFACVVGDGVTIGHGAIVHGAVIDDNVMIGMRAVILNGARIGRDCVIGAGAVVLENTEIPPGSLVVGMPAKARRALIAEEIAGIARSAEHYVATAARFASSATSRTDASQTDA